MVLNSSLGAKPLLRHGGYLMEKICTPLKKMLFLPHGDHFAAGQGFRNLKEK